MSFAKSYVAIRSLLGMQTTRERGLRAARLSVEEAEVVEVADVEPTFKMGHMYSDIIVGAWALLNASSQNYDFYFYNTDHDQGDEIEYLLFGYPDLDTFELFGCTWNQGGIAEVRIDGDLIGTIDFYTAGVEWNSYWTLPVVFAEAGIVVVNFKMIVNNPLSGNDRFQMSYIRFK